jgi:hypothetical protein
MAAAMAREKSDFAAFQFAKDEGVAGIAERSRHTLLMDAREPGHGIESAAPDDANLCLLQSLSCESRHTSQRAVGDGSLECAARDERKDSV